jgi:hypothetical protein
MTLTTPELAQAYSEAWANHDVDAIVALHTEDAVFHLHDVLDPFVGLAAIAATATQFHTETPDLRFDTVRLKRRTRRRPQPRAPFCTLRYPPGARPHRTDEPGAQPRTRRGGDPRASRSRRIRSVRPGLRGLEFSAAASANPEN